MDHPTYTAAKTYAIEQAARLHENYTVRAIRYGRHTTWETVRGRPHDFAPAVDITVLPTGDVRVPEHARLA